MRTELRNLGFRPSEADCQATIIAAAQTLGYLVHAERPARHNNAWATPIAGDAGFPDLAILGHGHLAFVELKRKPNKIEPAQRRWLDALGADPHVFVMVIWVPEQLDSFIAQLQQWAGR